MNHIRSLLSAAALLSLVAPADAQASPPSPANSTVPPCISLVGSNGTTPSQAFGQFSVVYRDLANNPIADALIVIDLSGIPELFLAADQLDPAAVVSCADKRVSKRTDASGQVNFCILGASLEGCHPSCCSTGARSSRRAR